MRLFIIWAFFALGNATADEVNLKFRVCSFAGAIEGVHYTTGSGEVKLSVPENKRSDEVMSYRGDGALIFYRYNATTGEKVVLARANVSNEVKEGLIIFMPMMTGGKFVPTKKGDRKYSAVMITDGSESFPNGSMKFINTTNRKLYLVGGKQKEFRRVVKTGEIVDHKIKQGFKGNFPLKVMIRTKDGGSKIIYNSRVFPNADVRDIYVISGIRGKQTGNLLRIFTLRERGDNAAIRLKK